MSRSLLLYAIPVKDPLHYEEGNLINPIIDLCDRDTEHAITMTVVWKPMWSRRGPHDRKEK